MIIDGYYHPVEIFNDLVRIDMHTDEIDALMEQFENKEEREDYIYNELLSGRAMTAISYGTRTGGKTVGVTTELLKRYMLYGERFMVCPRTQTQMKNGYLRKFINKTLNVDDDMGVNKKFKELGEIKYGKTYATIDGDIFAYCGAMSDAYKIKDDMSFDRCTTLLVDEAMRAGDRVLMFGADSAMKMLWMIFQTMARGSDYAIAESRMIFLSNSTERDNWLFNDLGVNSFWRDDSKYAVRNGIIVEKVDNYIATKSLNRSYASLVMRHSLSGKPYIEQAMDSTFGDNKSFIAKTGLNFKNLYIQLVIRDKCLGVFRHGDGFHVALIEMDKRSGKICNNPMYHTDDVSFQPMSDYDILLRDCYIDDLLTFGCQQSKNLFLEYIQIL